MDVKNLVDIYNKQNFEIAKKEAEILLKIYPDNSFLYNLLGSCCQNLGQLNKAKPLFLKSIELDKNNLAALNNLANILKKLGQFKLAENYYKTALEINANHINTLVGYGGLFYELNDTDKAIVLYKKALLLDNKIFQPHYNLALVYLSIGSLKKAEYHFLEALKINPNYTDIDKLLSRFTNYTENNTHLKQMNGKVNNLTDDKIADANLYFALGKAYEDLKKYNKSFSYLEIANKSKKKSTNYDIKFDLQIFNSLKNEFRNHIFKKNLSHISEKKIIFIVGLPRSGTSLVEQIISSHTEVYGGGELKFLEELILGNFYNDNSFDNLSKDIQNESLLKNIREQYYEKINNFKTNKKIITDKAPLNFRWIGFIKVLFPNAKIVHCQRDPKDNALSLYKNIFDEKLNWTYNQSDIFNFYSNYVDLMELWNHKMNSFIYDVKYESLISNPIKEIKKLIHFCDIDWQDNCVEFYKNKRPIKTVSIVQARKPLFKSSISSFKNYKEFLDNLFTNIEKKAQKKTAP